MKSGLHQSQIVFRICFAFRLLNKDVIVASDNISLNDLLPSTCLKLSRRGSVALGVFSFSLAPHPPFIS